MPILSSADAPEIRFEIYPTLTVDEIPDEIITRRTILRNTNRSILKVVQLTETEYALLQPTDEKQQRCQEAAIKHAAHDLIPTISQIVRDNENGIFTEYQSINWRERQGQLHGQIVELLKPYGDADAQATAYYSVSSISKPEG